MSNPTLKNLLKEYEQKRLNALIDLDKRKNDLYSSNKRLEEIDATLNNYALNKKPNKLLGFFKLVNVLAYCLHCFFKVNVFNHKIVTIFIRAF